MERFTTETGAFICQGEHVCCEDDECYCDSIAEALKKLSEYETLEEQGMLIKCPCAIGEKVWCIDSFMLDGTLRNPPIIKEIKFNHHHLEFVGKTVFLTKEAAEAALKEMEK